MYEGMISDFQVGFLTGVLTMVLLSLIGYIWNLIGVYLSRNKTEGGEG